MTDLPSAKDEARARETDPERVAAAEQDRVEAERGDASAQFCLAVAYLHGDGAPRNESEGIRWLRKAADQGHKAAMRSLADRLNSGFGVERDRTEAGRLYRLLAEQGNAEHQCRLARFLRDHHDEGEALKWYRKAAEQGHEDACYEVGYMLSQGWGSIAAEPIEAVTWLRPLAVKGHARAQSALGFAYEEGVGLPHLLGCYWLGKAAHKRQYEAAERLSDDFHFPASHHCVTSVTAPDCLDMAELHLMAGFGYPLAQGALGLIYEEGRGVRRDPTTAAKWLSRAAAQGLEFAQYRLAHLYAVGDGVAWKPAKAEELARKPAEAGKAWQQTRLGKMYLRGQDVPRDAAKAAKWLRKAAKQEDVEAQVLLAAMHDSGRGVEGDFAVALSWYRAAHRDDTEKRKRSSAVRLVEKRMACFIAIGMMYEHGDGLPHDSVRACMWYDMVAAQEHYLELASEMRDRVANDMAPADVAQARQMAQAWGP